MLANRCSKVYLKKKPSNLSSRKWLERQLNDPYVHATKQLNYVSRSAFKLLEIDDKFHFLANASSIIDIGCAPGGWLQVIAQRTHSQAKVVGVDILPIKTNLFSNSQAMQSAMPAMQSSIEEKLAKKELITTDCKKFIQGDFLAPETQAKILQAVDLFDVILSDMAINSTGHARTDHIRNAYLLEEAWNFAATHLKKGGVFVSKIFRGAIDADMACDMKKVFAKLHHFKPCASRVGSAEIYLVAKGFLA